MSIYNQAGTGGYKNRFVDTQKKFAIRKFDESDGFGLYKVERLGAELVEDQPIHIFTTRSDGRRKFVSHPDFPILKGDVIKYTDDGNDYLVVEQDTHTTVDTFGVIYRMEESISFKDKFDVVQTVKYYMTNTGTGSQDSNDVIPVSETKKQIWVQWNDLTKSIYKNQRFILGNIEAYKITGRDNFSVKGVLKLTLESTQDSPLDDLNNNIAHNMADSTSIPESGKTGVYFDADALDIPVGLTKSTSVYEYLNDSVVPSTIFTFRIDGLDPADYTIVASDDNSISIKTDEYYSTGMLVAIDASTFVEYSIPLTLKSAFG